VDRQVIKMHSATVSETQKALLNFARCYEARRKVESPTSMTPSSGLVAIVLLHNFCNKLTVYGVGPPQKSTSAEVRARALVHPASFCLSRPGGGWVCAGPALSRDRLLG
jgi:hypothetical protein